MLFLVCDLVYYLELFIILVFEYFSVFILFNLAVAIFEFIHLLYLNLTSEYLNLFAQDLLVKYNLSKNPLSLLSLFTKNITTESFIIIPTSHLIYFI